MAQKASANSARAGGWATWVTCALAVPDADAVLTNCRTLPIVIPLHNAEANVDALLGRVHEGLVD